MEIHSIMYPNEAQQRGLPHIHVALWVNRHEAIIVSLTALIGWFTPASEATVEVRLLLSINVMDVKNIKGELYSLFPLEPTDHLILSATTWTPTNLSSNQLPSRPVTPRVYTRRTSTSLECT